MGYDNRDYARETTDRGGWGSSGNTGGGFRDWPAWKKILATNVVVFLLQIFLVRPGTLADFPGFADLDVPAEAMEQLKDVPNPMLPQVSIVQEWFELDSRKVLYGQVWRVVTCGFCHSRLSFWHILMNMLFLYWFGSRLEQRYGSREFTLFYFGALLSSSFAYIFLDLYTGTMLPAIGASGAVWGIVALYALLYPYERIYVYFLFPVQIWFMALVYFLFDLHPVLLALSGQPMSSGVAHSAHVGGAIFGYLYYRYRWYLTPIYDRFTRRKQARRFANSRPAGEGKDVIPMYPRILTESTDESRMDEILAKISTQGRDSLSEEEEQFLVQQSERLRDNKK